MNKILWYFVCGSAISLVMLLDARRYIEHLKKEDELSSNQRMLEDALSDPPTALHLFLMTMVAWPGAIIFIIMGRFKDDR